MGIGICLFLHWENGISVAGRDWDLSQKKRQNWSGIGVLLAYLWDRDTG